MTDTHSAEATSQPHQPAGLATAIGTARTIAGGIREAATTIGRLTDRELAMLVGAAERVRDMIPAERLAAARSNETVENLRHSTHRGVDIAFDALAIAVWVAGEWLDRKPGWPSPRYETKPPIAQPAAGSAAPAVATT